MAVIIAGMQAAIGSCKSLLQYEQSLYSAEPCPEGSELDPAQIACSVFKDTGLKTHKNLILISSPHPALLDLPSSLGLEPNQYRSVHPNKGSDYDILDQAQELIKEDPDRIVLLTLTYENEAVSLVLAHPDQELPAYAELEHMTSDPRNEDRLNSVTYLGYSQGLNTLTHDQFIDLCDIFASDHSNPSIALGSPSGISSRNGIENILFIALLINRKMIPATKGYPGDTIRPPADNPFYIPDGSRPWLDQGSDFLRTALLIAPGTDNKLWKYWLVTEPKIHKSLPSVRPDLKGTEPYLLPIGGQSIAGLEDRLKSLESRLKSDLSLENIVYDVYTKFSAEESDLVCSLVGATKGELINEIQHALIGIQDAGKSKGIWTSPKGSYFSAEPLGGAGIAFVYPGAFNSYPNMAQNLFDYFPVIHQSVKRIISNISQSFSEHFIYARNFMPDPEMSNADRMSEFYNHPSRLIESGISISVLQTMILKDIFKIKPAAALGYSLGEISMLWANEIWSGAEARSNAWKDSDLFQSRLFGKMTTLREYWPDQHFQENFWGTYILKAPLESIQAAAKKENQVFLSIINTSEEVVISGVDEACQRVITELGCHALPMPFNASIHNPAMKAAYPAFVDLYRNDVTGNADMQFYSAADYQALELESDSLAQAMAKMTCNPFDFPSLVSKAYQDGIRIFIEVGPQKTCSRWIERILESEPHAVMPVNKKHQSDFIGILKVIGMLVSHQVPLDLSPLYTVIQEKTQLDLVPGASPGEIRPTDKDLPSSTSPASSNGNERSESLSPYPELESEYLNNLTRLSGDISKSHQKYLGTQGVLIKNISRILALQTGFPAKNAFVNNKAVPLYTTDQIIAFTIGDPRVCFGDLFANYEGKRMPRLPNGPLRYLDRVYEIIGTSGKVENGSSLVSEVDIGNLAWYLTDSEHTLPYVSLMEIALQPCGFLSAYMGSIKDMSGIDLYFRNLDGEATLKYWPQVIDSTITNRVELITSTTLQNVIIQEYSFDLFHKGSSFLQGKSSFGYFTKQMLQNQSGLDGSDTITQWFQTNPESGDWFECTNNNKQSNNPDTPHLPEIPQVWVSKTGGKFHLGYLYTNLDIPKDSWFYKAHFYQDPVMPGSLGVEAMARMIMESSKIWGIPQDVRWRFISDTTTKWKYRGQITPETDQITLEIHIQKIIQGSNGWQIIADGHLWKGNNRIYQVDNIALETY